MKGHKAQTALEYSVLISVVIAALVAMRVYMKHTFEGRLRSSIDDVGRQSDTKQLEITINRSTTGASVEESSAGETTIYTGYSGKGAPQITFMTKNSSERVNPWTNTTSLWE